MAGREITMAVPLSLETAYLLIIGQISFVYSKILFEFLSIYVSGTSVSFPPETIFVVCVVLVVPFILIVNILSGWLSTRETFAEFSEYPNSLFTLDMLMIIIFFILNNVVTFSILQSGNGDYLASLLSTGHATGQPTGAALTTEIAQIVPPFVYLCSGLICVLYILWNLKHQKERNRLDHKAKQNPDMLSHNRFLLFALFLHVLLLVLSLTKMGIVVEFICLGFWTLTWLWLNGAWIVTSPLVSKKTG